MPTDHRAQRPTRHGGLCWGAESVTQGVAYSRPCGDGVCDLGSASSRWTRDAVRLHHEVVAPERGGVGPARDVYESGAAGRRTLRTTPVPPILFEDVGQAGVQQVSVYFL